MFQTSEKNAELLRAHAATDKNFVSFTHYHSYYQIVLKVGEFTELKTPQWAHITSMVKLGPGFVVTIAVFESEFLYWDAALKYPLLTVK